MDAVFSLPGFVSLIFLVVCIGLNVLFALLISKKLNSVIKELKAEIYENDKVLSEKIQVARAQLSPLYALFDWNMPAEIIERTTPLIDFDKFFDIRKLCYIRKKYGFTDNADTTESSWLIHSGSIVGNPFLFLRTFSREMYDETYHGYLTIHWETYSTDSDGNTVVNHHSQTLHATVTAPAPRYEYYTKLVYVNDAAPDLSFSREPSGADKMSSSDENATIYTTDTPKAVKKKVGRAFTGGCVSVEEQRQKGGNPDVCAVFKYNYYMFEHDDKKLEEMIHKCRNGEILCGECKQALTEKINVFLEDHQSKREEAKEVVDSMTFDGFKW